MLSGLRASLYSARCTHNALHQLRSIHTTAPALKTHYDTLGVAYSATPKQIKAAYFDLAKKCHPDVNPGKESKDLFQKISQAYQVLGDEELRAEYNASLEHEEITFASDAYRNESPESVFKSAFGVNFDEMFSSRFGYTAEKDNIREYFLGISLMEAVMGSAKYIEINTHQRCVKCQGYGAAEGAPTTRVDCPRCYGSGQIPYDKPYDVTWIKPFETHEIPEFATCGDCLGRGYYISKPCSSCGGKGRVDVCQWHPVSVPPGVKHGQVINCPGIDGAPMLITIHIFPTPDILFEYDDVTDNVRSKIQIHYTTLIQGGNVEVRTIDKETHTLYIPPNTQPGTVVELEEYLPTHVFVIELFMPNSDNLTSYLDWTYKHVLAEEERHLTYVDTPLSANYCKTIRLDSLSKFKLFRNDLFNYTFVPFYRLLVHRPLTGLYGWAKRSNKLKRFVDFWEGSRGHTFHYPMNRKNAF